MTLCVTVFKNASPLWLVRIFPRSFSLSALRFLFNAGLKKNLMLGVSILTSHSSVTFTKNGLCKIALTNFSSEALATNIV